ncbi:MAG: ABC transporter ATP-binding protein, partial [Thermoleophilia bacterium]|nr:ABC transporter ATP-binding protein [Thermoleophilia bacterium]
MEATSAETATLEVGDSIVACRELSRRFGEGEAAVDALRGVAL